MAFDRRAFLAAALCLPALSAFGADDGDAVAVVKSLQDRMSDVLSGKAELGLRQRFDLLRPAIGETFDLDSMAATCYGSGWDDLAEAPRGQWSQALGDYIAATYAQRLGSFRAQGFEREAALASRAEAFVVTTRLIPLQGAPVPLDYVMRRTPQGWRIGDILANGSISELAQWRRSLRGQTVEELRRRVVSLLTP
jgi:phospholipid transport system substrate-binding protein